MQTRSLIESLAHQAEFEMVRFGQVGETPRFDAFTLWLRQGFHGTMAYMERGKKTRASPLVRLPTAKTAVVLAMSHGSKRPADPGGNTGKVACYAWGRDYHNLMGKRLRKLQRALRERGIDSWGGVDTAPIVERAWAAATGLGFPGKNCAQIIPGTTSWLLLAVLFVDVSIPGDAPLQDHCRKCRRCLDACPSQAFVAPRNLDSRRCISYWTIEVAELPPRQLRPLIGRWVFGCDRCQEVCPHNGGATPPGHGDLQPRHAWLDLEEILRCPDDELMERFRGTPLRRPKAAGLKRNALLVLANIGDKNCIPTVRLALDHSSPLVRGAAVWALSRLGDPLAWTHDDEDELVLAEVKAARQAKDGLSSPD
ncbi:MAG: tRNA epoxyqueuosine(34) reductase QueG [Proteobacteria bacterium]|nr:tRNA epoxyqueuosine(34) reductase QueG [Pseudomonadota bacterium]